MRLVTTRALIAILFLGSVAKAGAPDPQRARAEVKALFDAALTAFSEKRYDDTIRIARRIQAIPIEGEVRHVNDAQQIIDNARMTQKKEEAAPKRGLANLPND